MKLFIGLPVYSQAPVYFTQCLMALNHAVRTGHWPLAEPPVIEMGQGDGIARTRNVLTAMFLRSDCTHMLQIDCDLLWSVDHITRVLSHDAPVVGGMYAKKQDGPNEWVMNSLPDQHAQQPNEKGLIPVRYIGTGFICVKREVFEQMRARYPESRYRADYGAREMEFEFWPMRVYRPTPEDEGRYLSEDWFFCQRWLDMGGTVYADPQIALRHLGTASFPLQSQEEQLFGRRITGLPAVDSPAEVSAATG
jgi:hypothetical protein